MAFIAESYDGSYNKEVDYLIKDVEFEKVIVDADTMLFQAALSVQETYVVVTPKTFKGKPKEFKNQTEFWGHWKKKEGGYLADVINKGRLDKGLEPLTSDDFLLEEKVRLVEENINHLEAAITSFDFSVGRIKRAVKADDYVLVIGGNGNYRYDKAHMLAYKGARIEKPLIFLELKEAIIAKYKNNIEVVDGIEADDKLGHYGYQNYLNYKKTGEWKYCLTFVDKDIKQVVSPYFNYSNIEAGIEYVTPLEGARFFCAQLLSGDLSVDNIRGLPNFTADIQAKYSIGKTKGIGKATALKYLEPCKTIKELFERVVEAYRSYYTEPFTFTSHRGEELTYTWLDCLQENGILLYMQRKADDWFDIRKTLDTLGIKYGE